MDTRITATEAARNFTDILNRVKDKGEEFAVERNGEVVCRIVPTRPPKKFTYADFVRAWKAAPKPDPGYWDDVEEAIRNQGTFPMDDPRDR